MKLPLIIVATYLALLGVISPPEGSVCSPGVIVVPIETETVVSGPVAPEIVPESPKGFTVSAYSSTVEQTDSEPCIAADGTDVCRRWMLGETLCASNDYPFGTRLYLAGSIRMTCVVSDRMNARYTGKNYIDLYFGTDTIAAQRFGTRTDVPVSIDSTFETKQ